MHGKVPSSIKKSFGRRLRVSDVIVGWGLLNFKKIKLNELSETMALPYIVGQRCGGNGVGRVADLPSKSVTPTL